MQEPNQYRADRAAVRDIMLRCFDAIDGCHKALLAGDIAAATGRAMLVKTLGESLSFLVNRLEENVRGNAS